MLCIGVTKTKMPQTSNRRCVVIMVYIHVPACYVLSVCVPLCPGTILGYPDLDDYRVWLPVISNTQITKVERSTSDAISLAKELFIIVFREDLLKHPLEVNCTSVPPLQTGRGF